jgi:hypothetical protein
LAWLATESAYLGQRSRVRVGGRLIAPNLHVGIAPWAKAQPALHVVQDFIQGFFACPLASSLPTPQRQPIIITTGVRDAASLIHPVRDRVDRPERLYIPKIGTLFRREVVDEGTIERRLLVVQPLQSFARRKTAASSTLIATLVASFDGATPIQWFVPNGGVTGHWLHSSPQVSLITDLTEQHLTTLICG